MIAYASRTGTKRNLAAMRGANEAAQHDAWRILISRVGAWRTEGFRYGIDNGRFADFQAGLKAGLGESLPFNDEMAAAFERLIDRLGDKADWIVAPDTVLGGMASLDLSKRWLNRVLATCPLVLIAVQDGMEPADLDSLVSTNVGIFLGGSTEWKEATMEMWGRFCASRPFPHPHGRDETPPGGGCYYHVGRANSARRIALAQASAADSFDGSSVTRYAKTLPALERARQQPDMISARRVAA